MNELSYTNWDSMSDNAIAEHIGQFIKHNRIQKNKTQEDTAKEAGISRSTLSLLERGETVTLSTLLRVLRVLDLLDFMDSFKIQTTISPIALAKIEKKKRKRARYKNENEINDSVMKWKSFANQVGVSNELKDSIASTLVFF